MPNPGAADEVWARLDAIGGKVDEDELRYSLSRQGMKLSKAHLEDLIEKGLVVREGNQLQAVIPKRKDRRGPATRGFTDDDLIDRIHLFALITGAPPTKTSWNPSRVRQLLGSLRDKSRNWARLIALYDAGDWPSEATIRERFGSLNAALVLAGYDARTAGTQWKDPEGPRPKRRPAYGKQALEDAYAQAQEARVQDDKEALSDALYDLAVTAFTEADRL